MLSLQQLTVGSLICSCLVDMLKLAESLDQMNLLLVVADEAGAAIEKAEVHDNQTFKHLGPKLSFGSQTLR